MNWDDHFKEAHKNSWPVASAGMSREIYDREKKQIDAAALKHGYVLYDLRPKYVGFLRPE